VKKEHLKSALLVGLIIACIIMASKTFNFSNFNEGSEDMGKASYAELKETFCPQSYVISFGGGLHTGMLTDEEQNRIWLSSIEAFRFVDDDTAIEKVSPKAWADSVNSKGVILRMPSGISFNHVMSILEIESDFNYSVKRILINTTDKDEFYFSSNTDKEFYRVDISSHSDEFEAVKSDLSSQIDAKQKSQFPEYRTLDSIFSLSDILDKEKRLNGKFISNTVSIPIVDVKGVNPIIVRNGFRKTNTDGAGIYGLDQRSRDIAAGTFGIDMTLVKSVKDMDDMLIYMHGYGKKSLRYSVSGNFIFGSTQSPDIELEKSKRSFIESFGKSVSVIREFYGGVKGFRLSSYSEHLKGKSFIQEYDFSFDMEGISVLADPSNSDSYVKIQVTNGDITDFWIYPYEYGQSQAVQKMPVSFEQIITENIRTMHDKTKGKQKSSGYESGKSDETYYDLINRIEDVSLVYMLTDDSITKDMNEETAVPVWKIDVSGYTFLFSYYTGGYIRSYAENDNGLE
jgi:hypothetical protein